MSDSPTLEEHLQALAEAEKQAQSVDKNTLFDAIKAAGLTSIAVTFDGYGDSGQIEGITALAGETEVLLPDIRITLQPTRYHTEPESCSLPDALERLCYRYLSSEYGNWEDSDGAYGQFQFDVQTRTIHLDFNERFTDSHKYTHSF